MSYRADKLGDGRTDWRTDAGNDNTRRPILASGKNDRNITSNRQQFPEICPELTVNNQPHVWAIIGAVDTDVRCLLLSICGWPHNELATTRGNSVRMPPLAKYRHSRMTQADAEVVGDSFIIPLTTCADNMAKSGGSFVWKFFELSDDKNSQNVLCARAPWLTLVGRPVWGTTWNTFIQVCLLVPPPQQNQARLGPLHRSLSYRDRLHWWNTMTRGAN